MLTVLAHLHASFGRLAFRSNTQLRLISKHISEALLPSIAIVECIPGCTSAHSFCPQKDPPFCRGLRFWWPRRGLRGPSIRHSLNGSARIFFVGVSSTWGVELKSPCENCLERNAKHEPRGGPNPVGPPFREEDALPGFTSSYIPKSTLASRNSTKSPYPPLLTGASASPTEARGVFSPT